MIRSDRIQGPSLVGALFFATVASGAASACPGPVERALEDLIAKQEREIARERLRAPGTTQRSAAGDVAGEGLPSEFVAELVERFDLEPEAKDRPRTASCEDAQ